MSIKLNYQNAGLRDHELEYVRPLAEAAFRTLTRHTGPGHEMLGWLELPYTYDKEEFARIKAAAKRIQEQSQVLVVIGIGGSYLGARAGLERRYGISGARDRIYATTDRTKGALRKMAEQKGYKIFVVPDNIGGRFSCLSAVGLLPMAAGGTSS